MSVEYKRASLTLINTVDNVVYQCPVNATGIVMAATATNTASVEVSVTANIVNSGGVVDVSNEQITSDPLNPVDTTYLDSLIGQVLKSGDYISMRLDAVGAVNIFLSIQEQI